MGSGEQDNPWEWGRRIEAVLLGGVLDLDCGWVQGVGL